MIDWQIAEQLTPEDLQERGTTAAKLKKLWMDVADDMALIPENNVKVTVDEGTVTILVSQTLMECMRGC
jgi:hypothetical protein